MGSVLTSRKSSSTPSLPDATENQPKTSVASTEQAASADNLAAKVIDHFLLYLFNIQYNIVLFQLLRLK